MIKCYGQGTKLYFRDKLLLFDEIIILVSLALVILEICGVFEGKSHAYQCSSQVLRGIFRFLRIFLLIRKVSRLRKIKKILKVKTPADKIIRLLIRVKYYFDNMELINDIEWAISCIR